MQVAGNRFVLHVGSDFTMSIEYERNGSCTLIAIGRTDGLTAPGRVNAPKSWSQKCMEFVMHNGIVERDGESDTRTRKQTATNNLRSFTSDRVTIQNCQNLLLTLILDVLPSCLGTR